MTPLETCLLFGILAWLAIDPPHRYRQYRAHRRPVDPGIAAWAARRDALRQAVGE